MMVCLYYIEKSGKFRGTAIFSYQFFSNDCVETLYFKYTSLPDVLRAVASVLPNSNSSCSDCSGEKELVKSKAVIYLFIFFLHTLSSVLTGQHLNRACPPS